MDGTGDQSTSKLKTSTMDEYPLNPIPKPQVKSGADGRLLRSGDISPSSSTDSMTVLQEVQPEVNTHTILPSISNGSSATTPVVYRVYKRRFFGLVQLVLLNIVISWNWICFAPISNTAATYFNTSESVINWASTVVLFAFGASTPVTYYVLYKYGPKAAIIISATLTLFGNWIKYGGARAGSFAGVMFGQLLIGFAQTFVLTAPTSYSNLWFTPAGRTTATAIATLANAFGAALGQLISPFWVNGPSDIPSMILWVSILATVASLPSYFIPKAPPTPPSAGSAPVATVPKSLLHDIKRLLASPEFYLLFISFAVLVGFFNAFSSVLNQILEPYGFSEDEAGIAGAILIVVGLVSAAVSSPFIDKYRFYLVYIKVAVPLLTVSYLIFVFIPPTKSVPFAYVICAVLGGTSFGLVPVVLEFLVEIHYPLGAESSASISWLGGQVLGGVFILIMDALKEDNPPADSDRPAHNMHKALIFEAVLAMAVMPLPLCLGLFGRKDHVRLRRSEADKLSLSSNLGGAVGAGDVSVLVTGEENRAEMGGYRDHVYRDEEDEEEQRLSDHGADPAGR